MLKQNKNVTKNNNLNAVMGYLGDRVELHSATAMPNACGYLWNKDMLIQMNCRGYAVAQFMQPEPCKYSQGPYLEAKTFIQPEHPYFAHHPGRFFYLKDEVSGDIFSVPHEPCRQVSDEFCFSLGTSDIKWQVKCFGLTVNITLTLPLNGVTEIWSVEVVNTTGNKRRISLYPYFSIGYKSWMNQSATYDASLHSIIASAITPYQKIEDYEKNKDFKELTYFISLEAPSAWTTHQVAFEGEGGLSNPSALKEERLDNKATAYEMPVAVMQFSFDLPSQGKNIQHFAFGAAKDTAEIEEVRNKFFGSKLSLKLINNEYASYMATSNRTLSVDMDDNQLSNFINQWLPRQVFYHGDANRLTTDPQTRNYLQDNMAMSFCSPHSTRTALLTALSQQHVNGAMPDGILLHRDATLKYINEVPHADHAVWLTITLKTYLDETNDTALLAEAIGFKDSNEKMSVIEHIELALEKLLSSRDHRGLSFIEQGDWCDPMNMVGAKGKGVSSWLSLATAYAIDCWCKLTTHYIHDYSADKFEHFNRARDQINHAVNKHLWDGNWYARGITDDDVVFGVKTDVEGRIYLNPQSWALLSGAASSAKKFSMLNEVESQLNTPYGVMMLAPSYTAMREDIGRLTQKHPGVAENGSVYNHAAAFYAYSLYQVGEYNLAFSIIKKMLPNESDLLIRGQLPVYIPNYYRGAYYQLPEHAGRSSHLFNTGTVAWVYRCIIEELLGLKGEAGNLTIHPKLPDELSHISGTRLFMEAEFKFSITRTDVNKTTVCKDGVLLANNYVEDIKKGSVYQLDIKVPK